MGVGIEVGLVGAVFGEVAGASEVAVCVEVLGSGGWWK